MTNTVTLSPFALRQVLTDNMYSCYSKWPVADYLLCFACLMSFGLLSVITKLKHV